MDSRWRFLHCTAAELRGRMRRGACRGRKDRRKRSRRGEQESPREAEGAKRSEGK